MKAYLILAGMMLLALVYGAGSVQGRKAERAGWDLRLAQQDREAANQMAAAEAKSRAQERLIANLKDIVQQEHAHAVAETEAAHRAASLRIAAAGGLRDRAESPDGSCRTDRMPADSAAPRGAAPPAPGGCQLSAGTSQALLDLAARADHTAAYAAACHAWAVKAAAALQ